MRDMLSSHDRPRQQAQGRSKDQPARQAGTPAARKNDSNAGKSGKKGGK
jgi:hypothetical protein